MELTEAILTRRSVRHFLDVSVDETDVEKILRAGMQAPSANNSQPWRFVVITQREKLDAIPEFHPYAQMMREATLAILVCAYVPEGKLFDLWVQDCSAATQNMLLTCHALGLGAVWLGIHPRPERTEPLRKLFDLPAEIKPVTLIAVGHPAEKPQPVDRFDLEKIHCNRW